MIPSEVSEACARTLREASAQLEYHAYDTGHKVDLKGMQALKRWWNFLPAARPTGTGLDPLPLA